MTKAPKEDLNLEDILAQYDDDNLEDVEDVDVNKLLHGGDIDKLLSTTTTTTTTTTTSPTTTTTNTNTGNTTASTNVNDKKASNDMSISKSLDRNKPIVPGSFPTTATTTTTTMGTNVNTNTNTNNMDARPKVGTTAATGATTTTTTNYPMNNNREEKTWEISEKEDEFETSVGIDHAPASLNLNRGRLSESQSFNSTSYNSTSYNNYSAGNLNSGNNNNNNFQNAQKKSVTFTSELTADDIISGVSFNPEDDMPMLRISGDLEENVDDIKEPMKREEQRLKQSLTKGNHNILQPLTKKRKQGAGEKESCFKVSNLSHITAQMLQNKAEYGRPCVAKAHTKFIAVGMENGAVFVFDHFEKLSVVLPVTEVESPGSVTTMAFSHNGQNLIVGHQKGVLVLWDIINKKQLKLVRDAYNAPIVYSNFYKMGQLKVLTADAKGLLSVWTFSKIFFSYQADRQNISSHKIGVVYDISIHKPNPNYRHALDSFSLCAVANRNCVLFIALEPTRSLLPRIEHDPADGCVPVVAWMDSSLPPPRSIVGAGRVQPPHIGDVHGSSPQPPSKLPPPSPLLGADSATPNFRGTPTPPPPPPRVPPSSSSNDDLSSSQPSPRSAPLDSQGSAGAAMAQFQRNPIIACGVGRVLQLFEVYCSDERLLLNSRNTDLIKLRGIGELQLGNIIIAMRWLNDRMLVILTTDFRVSICSGIPSEVTEVISIENRSLVTHTHFPDPVNQRTPIPSYANAVEVIHGVDRGGQDNKLLLLGSQAVTQMELLSWDDRVSKLIIESEWLKAFCLVIDFFEELSQKKIIPTPSVKRLTDRMPQVILDYVNFGLKNIKTDDDLSLVGSIAMDYCVSTQQMTLLFDQVFGRMKEVGGREIFFQLLEPYILCDRINKIPPNLLSAFMDYLLGKNRVTEAEQVILHLSWDSFDLNQVVKDCQRNHFFTALCYIHNEAFEEFMGPANDMFFKFIQASKDLSEKEKEKQLQKTHQLLLYFRFVMEGITFPWRKPIKRPTKARQQIIAVLFDKSKQLAMLQHLLSVNLQCTLAIMKMIFDDVHLFRLPSATVDLKPPNLGDSSISGDSHGMQYKRSRRTSMQVKDMLSTAQSAVVNSAKWAINLGSVSDGKERIHNDDTDHTPIPVVADGDYSIDPKIPIPTRQEMLKDLITLLHSEITLGRDKKDQETFFEFCAPYVVAGVCTIDSSLMSTLLASYFNRATALSEKIEKIESNLNNIRNRQTTAARPTISASGLGVNNPADWNRNLSINEEQQLEKLRWDKQHIENTLLVLLGRQTDITKTSNMKQLLRDAKNAKVHKVELYLYKCMGDHQSVINAYLSDPDMRSQVFDYLHNLYQDCCDAKAESKQTQGMITTHHVLVLAVRELKTFVDIDPVRTAILVFTLMSNKYGDAIASLADNSRQQYMLMKTINDALNRLQEEQLLATGKRVSKQRKGETKSSGRMTPEPEHTPKLTDEYMRKLQELLKQNKIEFDMKHHELYIQLLCQYEKGSVLDYLQENADKYTIVNAQRSCEKEKVLHACAYLQERSGDPKGALELYVKSIKKCVDDLWQIYQQHESLLPDSAGQVKISSHGRAASSMGLMTLAQKIEDASSAIDQLNLAIGLCRRQTLKEQLNESAEALWDLLLDECLSIQQDIAKKVSNKTYQEKYTRKVRENMKTIGSEFVGRILEAMMGMKINLSKMFIKVVDKGSSKEYVHYRDTVDVMLSTYQYETNMLKTAVHLFGRGAFLEYEKFINSSRHAFKTPDNYCKICEGKLIDIPLSMSSAMNEQRINITRSQAIQMFACGHAIHSTCMDWDVQDLCPICGNLSMEQQRQVGKAITRAQELRRNAGNQVESKAVSSANATVGEYLRKIGLVQQDEKRSQTEEDEFDGRQKLRNLRPANPTVLQGNQFISFHTQAPPVDAALKLEQAKGGELVL